MGFFFSGPSNNHSLAGYVGRGPTSGQLSSPSSFYHFSGHCTPKSWEFRTKVCYVGRGPTFSAEAFFEEKSEGGLFIFYDFLHYPPTAGFVRRSPGNSKRRCATSDTVRLRANYLVLLVFIIFAGLVCWRTENLRWKCATSDTVRHNSPQVIFSFRLENDRVTRIASWNSFLFTYKMTNIENLILKFFCGSIPENIRRICELNLRMKRLKNIRI